VFGPNEYHKGTMMSVLGAAFRTTSRPAVPCSCSSPIALALPMATSAAISSMFDDVNRVINVAIGDRQMSAGCSTSERHRAQFQGLMLAATPRSAPNQHPVIDMPEQIPRSYQYFTQSESIVAARRYNGALRRWKTRSAPT